MVCKRCSDDFGIKRGFAFIIDVLLLYAIAFLANTVVGLIMRLQGCSPAEVVFAVRIVGFCMIALFLLKDSFRGKSLGKVCTRVTVLDNKTNKPIGAGKSFLRNLILVIPIMVIVEFIFVIIGRRLGDRIANTRVVWDSYAQSPVFNLGAQSGNF